jgi:hypothetical protein
MIPKSGRRFSDRIMPFRNVSRVSQTGLQA